MLWFAGAELPMVQVAPSDAGAGVTVVTGLAALTFTCTGMETLTPVPVKVTVPVYAAAVVNEAVFKLTDRTAGFDRLTLKLLPAPNPIQVWLALAVSATAEVDAVLNWIVCAAGGVVPIVQPTMRDEGAGTTATPAAAATVTCTGIETLTPVPVSAIEPL